MRKGLLALITLLLLLGLYTCAGGEAAEAADEWTVMVYICGADLESKYGFGTENLEEIAQVAEPENPLREYFSMYGSADASFSAPGRVNVLIETGGAKAWHARDLGMNVSRTALQIWRYDDAPKDTPMGTFELKEELPLVSMAKPETLSAFIRWSTEHYPAKKYALVLWGHGGGSATGIFIDELFGNEYMTLDLLDKALADGGTQLELLLFDACMMANLETACAVQDHAKWMVASEEVVAGNGTAIGDWLQYLYYAPAVDGRILGRWICDTAMIKYGNRDNKQARELITWSVIDLGKVKRLEKNFDRFFEYATRLYRKYPAVLLNYVCVPFFSEGFGTGHENMFDLGEMLNQSAIRRTVNAQVQKDMHEALADAVDYCVRGSGRPAARGLSFCYATNFSADKLAVYARNCPSPHYLALLDGISTWEAPQWVFETAEKLPELSEEHMMQISLDKKVWEDGTPAFSVTDGEAFISMIQYNLYRKDKTTGSRIRLGKVPVYYDSDAEWYRIYELGKWPAIDGNLCQIELQNLAVDGSYNLLFNIPVKIDSEFMNMRCAYWYDRSEWQILGVWEGYDNDSIQFNRNVRSLSQLAGREFNLLYEVYRDKKTAKPYVFSPPMILYRSMTLEEITLPRGTYYLEYVIYDIFMRPMYLEQVELLWDGEKMTIVGEPWEGTAALEATY